MTTLTYRSYRPGDEEGITTLWNACVPGDPITRLRFRNLVLLDPNFDPQGLRVAELEHRIVGVLYAVRRRLPMIGTELEPDRGWITFFYTDPSLRRQGVGARLLQEGEDFLRRHGRRTVFFSSYAPNYMVPGIDGERYPEGLGWLQASGFTRNYTAVAMDRSLVDFHMPFEVAELKQQREQEGFTFQLAQDSDLVELIDFATDVFNPDWGRGIREGLLQQLRTDQILIAREQGKLVGFCQHGGYEGVAERFGPFGVDPSMQGKGLGKILLYDCLALMRAQGLHGAWFLWTGEQSPAGHLYRKAGFHVTRRFDIMSKPLQ
ncbi:GNAT family N-acetyltransferase [Paenibacillus glucanolyticus]|jgi:mycothiol synthase|uniref:GNAT family N-acetyltransferase n=1 Tax=Paenibacillus TaxID=44249 RepID=UPI0003E29B75|nr:MULTISPECIES: GNAT family N-acetyltransferase [Paenibacillus]ANA80994.1 acetyltransferase [Paenibacillus glucanolyticus]AVV54934.1 GNAT family N-acetyltransferase [Paenibacillus glucanolyticus]ETT36446.1 GCN5-like N-acetyltransferase [Paenibacillus sp. FSL R5-808]OMF70930.1 GNAT family N-acetyltransferase [Paenibacillus glucanolyticus]